MNFYAENHKTEAIKPSAATGYTKKEERINAVIELCRKHGYVVRKDIESELKISQATAIILLRELTEDGLWIKKVRKRTCGII